VVGDQHAMPRSLQVENDVLNVGHGDRIDACERLIEEDEAGRDHSARVISAGALAARQRVRGALQRRQVQFREQRAKTLLALRRVKSSVSRTRGCSSPRQAAKIDAPAAVSDTLGAANLHRIVR